MFDLIHPRNAASPPLFQAVQTFLADMDAALPAKVFGKNAREDITQLAELSRVLMLLPADHPYFQEESRLARICRALIQSALWPDLVQSHLPLSQSLVTLAHFWTRFHPDDAVWKPLERLLQAGYLQYREWTPLRRFDLSVQLAGLQAYGLRLHQLPATMSQPRQAAALTPLYGQHDRWIWRFQPAELVHYLLRSAALAELPIPEFWEDITAWQLVAARRQVNGFNLPEQALSRALLQPVDPLIRRSLSQYTTSESAPAQSWDQAKARAQLAVISHLYQPQEV